MWEVRSLRQYFELCTMATEHMDIPLTLETADFNARAVIIAIIL